MRIPRSAVSQRAANSSGVCAPSAIAVNTSSSIAALRAAVRWYALTVSKKNSGEGCRACSDMSNHPECFGIKKSGGILPPAPRLFNFERKRVGLQTQPTRRLAEGVAQDGVEALGVLLLRHLPAAVEDFEAGARVGAGEQAGLLDG